MRNFIAPFTATGRQVVASGDNTLFTFPYFGKAMLVVGQLIYKLEEADVTVIPPYFWRTDHPALRALNGTRVTGGRNVIILPLFGEGPSDRPYTLQIYNPNTSSLTTSWYLEGYYGSLDGKGVVDDAMWIPPIGSVPFTAHHAGAGVVAVAGVFTDIVDVQVGNVGRYVRLYRIELGSVTFNIATSIEWRLQGEGVESVAINYPSPSPYIADAAGGPISIPIVAKLFPGKRYQLRVRHVLPDTMTGALWGWTVP